MLNTVYIKQDTLHMIMMKVEWNCTCSTNGFSAFNQCYKNPFWNWSKEFIIDTDLLDTRTGSKRFNLSMCNRLMFFALIPKTFSSTRRRVGVNSNRVIKRVASKILIRTLYFLATTTLRLTMTLYCSELASYSRYNFLV